MKKVLTVALPRCSPTLRQPGAALTAAPLATHVDRRHREGDRSLQRQGQGRRLAQAVGVGVRHAEHRPGAMPIDQVALDKNGADAVFESVAADKV